jgi:hypothetical protein
MNGFKRMSQKENVAQLTSNEVIALQLGEQGRREREREVTELPVPQDAR